MRIPAGCLALIAALSLVLTACSSGGSADEARGDLIITRQDAILRLKPEGGDPETLVAAKSGRVLQDATVSPAGDRIMYVEHVPLETDTSVLKWGSNVYVLNLAGGGPELVYQYSAPDQLIRFPAWLGEDEAAAVFQETIVTDGKQDITATLYRIDLGTGARTKLFDDVALLDSAADGETFVYAQLAPDWTYEELKIAARDGTELRSIPPSSTTFNHYEYLAYSPDGSRIAFSAVDPANARTSERMVSAVALGPQPAPNTHAGPGDIWSVDESGALRMEADLKESAPSIAWSSDGRHLYILSPTALYDLNMRNGALTRIGDGIDNAQISWAPR